MKTFRFTVRGQGKFPFDMLRYDSCWPDTSDDAMKLDFDPQNRFMTRDVTLLSMSQPTSARWSSFMWSVKSCACNGRKMW